MPDFSHGVKVEVDIMIRTEYGSQDLSRSVEMSYICTTIAMADSAGAIRIQRPLVPAVGGILYIELSPTRKKLAVAGISCRHHAVEHIHTPRHALYQILRRPHPHQI